MLKLLHPALAAVAMLGFAGRLWLAEHKPEILRRKWLRIAPHVLDTLLLLSGIGLVWQGGWLNRDYRWLLLKLVFILAYIATGMLAMRMQGQFRRRAGIGAFICLLFVAAIAINKHRLLF